MCLDEDNNDAFQACADDGSGVDKQGVDAVDHRVSMGGADVEVGVGMANGRAWLKHEKMEQAGQSRW